MRGDNTVVISFFSVVSREAIFGGGHLRIAAGLEALSIIENSHNYKRTRGDLSDWKGFFGDITRLLTVQIWIRAKVLEFALVMWLVRPA